MKGLGKYIKKHGRHLTERMVMETITCKWDGTEIERSIKDLVYYNVSRATLGDMIFLVNTFGGNKRRGIEYALNVIGYMELEGYAFDLMLYRHKGIDLRKYI